MKRIERARRAVEPILSIGQYEGEPENRRAGRRVIIAATFVATTLSVPTAIEHLSNGFGWVAALDFVSIALSPIYLLVIWRWPKSFPSVTFVFFLFIFGGGLAETAMFGGLFDSGLVAVFGIVFMMAAFVAFGARRALIWLVIFAAGLIFSAATPHLVAPIYELAHPVREAAFNLIGVIRLAMGSAKRQKLPPVADDSYGQ